MRSGQITAWSPVVRQGVVHAAEDDEDPLMMNIIRIKRSCLGVNLIFPMMQRNGRHVHRPEFSQATSNSL